MVLSVNNIVDVNNRKQIMIVNNHSHENILLIGSCRIVPFLNYLMHHDLFGNKFNYLCILVYVPEMIQLSEEIIFNEEIKKQICGSTILFSEYVKNYNYFNTQRLTEKSIFNIHNSFTREIIIPNWGDICLYTKDLIQYKNLKNEFDQLIKHEISLQDFTTILQNCQKQELQRHANLLNKSNYPELITFTNSNLTWLKLAHTLNHPSNIYFIEMYRLIIEKNFAQSPYFLPQSVIDVHSSCEFLKNDGVDTKLTYYDRVCLGININNQHYLDENQSNHYILGI